MAKNLQELIRQADDYTVAYCRQYKILDKELIRAIFVQHLAYLINQEY